MSDTCRFCAESRAKAAASHRARYTGYVSYPPRVQAAKAVFHVTLKGNDSAPVFYGDHHYAQFLDFLHRVCVRCGWQVLAYCLMGNHIHLVTATPQPNLASGMQQLASHYARWLNRDLRRKGHAFGRRYWSRVVTDDPDLIGVLAYVACNACEAGLCGAPDAWDWNSYAAVMGEAPVPPALDVARLLSLLDPDPEIARLRYRTVVERRWAELQERRWRQAAVAAVELHPIAV